MTDQERFMLALERTMSLGAQSIGTQQERLLHRTLKYFLAPDESCHEVRMNGFIADIYDPSENHIWEIQTASFDRLRGKLAAFLTDHRVTVVYPILRNKYICWVDPETGEVLSRRKSPRSGRPTDILPEIYRLQQLADHPHLDYLGVLLDGDEYRLQDGWSRDGKRGSHRLERSPLELVEMIPLQSPVSFAALLPTVPSPFTRKDLAKVLRLSPQKTGFATTALERLEVIKKTGQQGNAFLYEFTNNSCK